MKEINNLTNQRRLRESKVINNRRLVNQNLFRELMRRNNGDVENIIISEEMEVNTKEEIKRQLDEL